MNVQHNTSQTKGEFFVEVNSKVLAMMTYSKAGTDKIIIDHTEVDESLKGQGVGFKLVEAAVKYARENDLKIIPLCPFANSVFKKTEVFKDLLI